MTKNLEKASRTVVNILPVAIEGFANMYFSLFSKTFISNKDISSKTTNKKNTDRWNITGLEKQAAK